MTRKLFSKPDLFVSLLTFALLVQASFLSAQQLATLSVTVTDPTGSVVPGALVTLNNPRTGVTRTQVADMSGSAVLTALTAGEYQLSVKADPASGSTPRACSTSNHTST